MANDTQDQEMTFWDHLDELRKVFFRIAIVVSIIALIAFINKTFLFDIIFAPHRSDFITYRALCELGTYLRIPSICPGEFHVDLINTQLASQLIVHMSVAFYAGLVIASPYIIYQLFSFIKPALYENERKYSTRTLIAAFILFFCGLLLNYYAIFPLSFRFLGTYQVSEFVENKITLSSYISTFTTLSIAMGAVFEIPILAFFFAKTGLIKAQHLKKYRRHALVIILILSAIITPADLFSMFLLAIPMYMLYELSIGVVKKTQSRTLKKEEAGEQDNEYENPYQEG